MHKFFSLGILIIGILAIHHIKLDTLTGIENYTLLVVGFIILGGILSAEIFAEILKFPKVTGYVFTGALLGPYVFNILTIESVIELKMFNSLAVGLIALTAGLELGVKELSKVFQTIVATTVFKILLLPLFVGGSLVFALYHFPAYLTEHSNFTSLIALGLIFSTLSIGTSPAIVIAVASEVNKPGRVKDLILGSAIFKDIVVVVTLAITLAISKTMISDSVTSGGEVAKGLLSEIGISLIIGIVFGFISIAYAKYIKARMLLFILLLVLIITELCRMLHGELLLSCIVTGFMVRNFSKYEHDLMEPLKLVSLPTFIVFFTIVGASFDLERAWKVLPVGFMIFAFRSLSYYLGSKAAGILCKEEKDVSSRLWLGYIPQAGVTLGLVGLASTQIPQYSLFINDLGLTLVAFNLVLGPLGLRFALSGNEQSEDAFCDEATPVSFNGTVDDIPIQTIRSNFELCDKIHRQNVKEVSDEFFVWYLTLKKSFSSVLDANRESFDRSREISKWFNQDLDLAFECPSISKFGHSIELVYDKIRTLPTRFVQPMPERLLVIPEEISTLKKWHLYGIRLKKSLGLKIERKIDPQYILLRNFGYEYADFCCQASVQLIHVRNIIIKHFIELAEGSQTVNTAKTDEIVTHFANQLQKDSEYFSSKALANVYLDSSELGSPMRKVPSSQRAKEAKNQAQKITQFHKIKTLEADTTQIFKDEFGFLDISFKIRLRLSQMIEVSIVERMNIIMKSFHTSFESAIEKIKQIEETLMKGETWIDLTTRESQEALSKEMSTSIDLRAPLRDVNRFLADTSSFRLTSQIKRLVDLGDKTFTVFTNKDFHSAFDPDENIDVTKVNLGELAKKHLLDDLLSDIEELLSSYRNSIVGFEDVSHKLSTLNDFAVATEDDSKSSDIKQLAMESLKVSRIFLEEQIQDASSISKSCSEKILAEYNNVVAKLFEAVLDSQVSKSPKEKIGNLHAWTITQIQDLWYQIAKPRFIEPLFQRTTDFFKKNLTIKIAQRSESKIFNHDISSPELGRLAASELEFGIDDISKNPLLKKAFTLKPLRDSRLLVGVESTIESMIKTCSLLGTQNESTLVVADPGSGMTSLLNLIYQRLEQKKVYRFEPDHPRLRGRLLGIIADEIESDIKLKAIRYKLNESKQIMIIDDLQKWFPVTDGFTFLRSLKDLIFGTKDSTIWIVGMSSHFYRMFKEESLLDFGFDHHIRFPKMTAVTAKEIIEQRLKFSGLSKIEFEGPSKILKTANRLGFLNSMDFYISKLSYTTSSDLTCMLNLWLKNVTLSKSTNSLTIHGKYSPPDLSLFYRKLPPQLQATIHCFLIYGGLKASDLSLLLGLDRKKTEDILLGLEVQKQIMSPRSTSSFYYLNPSIRFAAKKYFYGDQNGII